MRRYLQGFDTCRGNEFYGATPVRACADTVLRGTGAFVFSASRGKISEEQTRRKIRLAPTSNACLCDVARLSRQQPSGTVVREAQRAKLSLTQHARFIDGLELVGAKIALMQTSATGEMTVSDVFP